MGDNNSNGDSILNLDPDILTPGMKQYLEIKKAHPDCLVMLRMGDFYEMFYEDAVTAARELEITLTARGKGEKRAPLAGVPFHALEPYLGRLVKRGYKVALVEQLEDPQKAKGLVKRGLVRIVTPGTVIESSMLDEKENNYIMALTSFGEELAVAFCEMSTGEFFTATLHHSTALRNEITRLNPSECLLPESLLVNAELMAMIKSSSGCVNTVEDYYFRPEKAKEILRDHFALHNLESFGLEDQPLNVAVCGALLHYLTTTQKNSLPHLKKISFHRHQDAMSLDAGTIRNLELAKNIRDGSSRGTLLAVLDKTNTVLGARALRRWLQQPLLRKKLIEKRLDAVDELHQHVIRREEIKKILAEIADIERLISRVNYGNATPRDVVSLRNSLFQIPVLKEKLAEFQSGPSELLREINTLVEFKELAGLLQLSLRDDAPLTAREGGIIKRGYDSELDQLYSLKQNSHQYLQALEEKERQKTGIHSLKVGYNNVFGYFIEVSRKNSALVPSHYRRKQTTANAERYITEELKIEEEKILGAEERILELEYSLFRDILHRIAEQTEGLQHAAVSIAVLDVLCSLATVAAEQGYVKPELVEGGAIHLTLGRHPVLETIEPHYIANDVSLNPGEMLLITGPNMSGKSSLMRKVALIILMAQMGSFVPAEKAVLGITDKIFTRVGAYDDLSSGQSTFMVEMNETAFILNNATENSLIILDEIGRGTSTFDGVSIAWSVAEHIYNRIKAKTLFSTHYHVLNKLQEKFSRIKNYNLAVKEVKGEVIFLRKLVAGGTDQSYGVHVAKLAGLPLEVVERAREIQEILEKDDEMMRKIQAKKLQEQKSLGEFRNT